MPANDAFVRERAAFFSGYGNGGRLMEGLRAAVLLVPVDSDGMLFTMRSAGLLWMLGFTTEASGQRFFDTIDRDDWAVGLLPLPTDRLIDDVLDKAPEPTGLVIDAVDPGQSMSFPPVREFTPNMCVEDFYDDEGN